MDHNLHSLLNPRSVAVIGVSRNPDSFGYPMVEIAQRGGYAGRLHLVNPNADEILGLPCHARVSDIDDEIDCAVVMVPCRFAAAAIEDCIRKRVRGLVMITAGFAERDAEGRAAQDAMVARARTAGIRMIGPNTLGFFSAPARLDMIMSGFIREGPTALVTQSGNLTQSLTFPGAQRGLGFRYVVGLGNQVDVQAHDLIRYFREDPEIRSIAVHIEGLRDGRAFMEAVRETVPVKPVVVFKSGRTAEGARAARSHTASIAGNDEVYSAALRQCGAIQAENFSGMISQLLALNAHHARWPRGGRVCILSEGGGDCVLTSDACVRRGLSLPELTPASQARLRAMLPPNGTFGNPLDLAGWESVTDATAVALADEQVDGVVIVGGFAGNFHISPRDFDKEARQVARMGGLLDRASKPVLIYSYSAYKPNPLTDQLSARGMPLFLDHHDAVASMATLVAYARLRSELAGRPFPAAAANTDVPRERRPLPEPEAKALLRQYGIATPTEALAADADEAVALAERIGYPVVLKVVSRQIVHKSDVGGVRLNLADAEAVRAAVADILAGVRQHNPKAKVEGLLVGAMDRTEGVELILGGLRDPVFGPVLMLGLGGIFVEALRDVSLRVCPLDVTDAAAMIDELRGQALVRGTRGRPGIDCAALAQALCRVARLLVEHPEIAELDLNPVKAHAAGLVALDARMLGNMTAGPET